LILADTRAAVLAQTEQLLVLVELLEHRQRQRQDSAVLVMRKFRAQQVAEAAEADMQAEAEAQTQQALHQFMEEVQAVAAIQLDTRSAQAKQVSMD
jgi:RNA processing factor Prp31